MSTSAIDVTEESSVNLIDKGTGEKVFIRNTKTDEEWRLEEVGSSVNPEPGVYNVISRNEHGDENLINSDVLVGIEDKVKFEENEDTNENFQYGSM